MPAAGIEATIPDVLRAGAITLASIWQWLLEISPEPGAATSLLCGLARGEGVTGLADQALRDDLLALYVARELLAATPTGYSFRVPLLGQWIAQQRR